jgi:hypothetical protein
MPEFGALAELSVELAPGEAAAIRDELEGELSDIAIGAGGVGGALGASGGAAGGSALTDGGMDDLVSLQQEQVDLTEELLDEIESANFGGGGGSGLVPLSLVSGTSSAASGAAALLSRLSSSRTLRAAATGGASVTGGVAAPVMSRGGFDFAVNQASEVTGAPTASEMRADIPGSEDARAPLSPWNFIESGLTGREGLNTATDVAGSAGVFAGLTDPAAPPEPDWLDDMNRILGRSPPEPDWLERIERLTDPTEPTMTSESTADANVNAGPNGSLQSGTDPTANRAKADRQQRGGATVNVSQNFELAQRQLEQALEEAKREAVREVKNRINQEIPGVTSQSGL